jgi:hypothetical protein
MAVWLIWKLLKNATPLPSYRQTSEVGQSLNNYMVAGAAEQTTS